MTISPHGIVTKILVQAKKFRRSLFDTNDCLVQLKPVHACATPVKHVETQYKRRMSTNEKEAVKENLVEDLAYQYLQKTNEGRKRYIRRKAAKFVVRDGELL